MSSKAMALRSAKPTEWPELLTARDIGEVLGLSTRSAQRLIRDGSCGPYVEIGGRRYVWREKFLKALRAMETTPQPPPTATPRPPVIPAPRKPHLK